MEFIEDNPNNSEILDLETSLKYLEPSDHVCLIYDTHEEYIDSIIHLINFIINNEEKIICILNKHDAQEVSSYLNNQNIDVKKLENEGQLILLDKYKAYNADEFLDLDLIIRILKENKNSLQEYFSRIFIIGELFQVTGSLGLEKLVKYREILYNELNFKIPIIPIGQYNMKNLGPEFIKWILKTHNLTIKGDEAYKNSSILSTEDILKTIKSEKEAENWLNEIQSKEIRKNKEFYADIFGRSSQPFGIRCYDGTIAYTNQAFNDLVGYNDEEIKEINLLNNLTPKKWHDKERGIHEEIIKTGQSAIYEKEYIKKDGTLVPIEVLIHPALDDQGIIKYFYYFITDITARKMAENALIESESKYRTLFNNAADGILILDFDVIIECNQKSLEIYAASEEEIIGKTPYDFSPTYQPNGEKSKEKAIKNIKKALDGFPQKFEWKHIKNNRSFINEVSLNRFKIRDKYLILAIIRDVTERKKTENLLIESENQYRMVGQLISDFAYSCIHGNSSSYEVDWITDSFFQLSGFSQEKLDQEKCWLFTVHPEDEQAAHDQLTYLNAGDKSVAIFRIINKNGDVRWLRNHVQCVEDKKIGKLRIYGAAQDITELKNAEWELQQSEEKFRALINNSADIIRILDKNGKIVFDSPSSKHVLGYPEGSLIGKSPLEFIHPDDYEKVKNDLDEVYKDNNPLIPTEFRIKKANGKYLPVESVGQNMTNIPGIDGVVVTTHPIKERKEMEDALRESNEKYRTLFESDPNYTVLVGLDGKILDINNSAIDFIGMPREELLNKKYTDTGLFSEEDEAIQIKNFANAIAGLDGEPFQCKISNKDGDESWLESQLVPLKKDGLVNTVLIIATDITTRKIATDKLKYSLNEKEILLNEIHHRVKNNMQIVSSLLNLQTEHLKDENAVNILKESQNRVRSMAMIHENLYKSKDFTYINFHDYVFKLTSDLLYSYNISQDKIRPELDIGEIKLNLETAVPCGLIISELVTNCIKHAFPGKENGILKLKITKLDDKFKLIIQDNGVGFPDNVDYKNTTSLGLQLVNSLVDQINGTLELIKNDGTKFQIIFEELKYKERLYNKDKNKNKNS